MAHPLNTRRPWPVLRCEMICREAIIARMAEDVADIAYSRGLGSNVTEEDMLRLGWLPRQIAAHSRAVIAAAIKNRTPPVKQIRRKAA